jgi:hypothetical protein
VTAPVLDVEKERLLSLSQKTRSELTGSQSDIAAVESRNLILMIQNLERFCNEIVKDKLLWTAEVLIFFGITNEM